MMHDTLISAEDLQRLLSAESAGPVVCDCRFDLTDPDAGRRQYAEGHVPGAVYLHLDQDLSGSRDGTNGRHPLPDRGRLVERLGALGAHDTTQLVFYDASGGMFAARAWWLARWLGHPAAAVLDGGTPAWHAAGGAWTAQPTLPRPRGDFTDRGSRVPTIDHAGLRARPGPAHLVVDARAADRFRGENETLDPVGGHIPGAVNRCFRDNLAGDGRFKAADVLRAEWQAVPGLTDPLAVVHQCGSGVSACHNLLAMEVAGLRGSALYPGSWSEWCARPGAPIATGA